ncbi:MAG: hypothetical protein JET69_01160 [Methanomassiliicoccales archaeon]|nr:hypothetical protein [Methanomassiliicoccales archaeon]
MADLSLIRPAGDRSGGIDLGGLYADVNRRSGINLDLNVDPLTILVLNFVGVVAAVLIFRYLTMRGKESDQ